MAEVDQHKSLKDEELTIDELIHVALTEEGEDAAWRAVTALRLRGGQDVLDRAQLLCKSSNAHGRKLGADILGQLGEPESTFREERFQALAAMIQETDADVLQAIAIAFGSLNDARAIALLVPFVNHHDADVRYGVVHGMSRHEDETAINSLIHLSKDIESDVRDWATFGLGQMISTDTPDIRAALIARIGDPDRDTRCEAIHGLAERKDPRCIQPLIDELASENVTMLALEAAEKLGDVRLRPALQALKENWGDEDDSHVRQLDSTIASCNADAFDLRLKADLDSGQLDRIIEQALDVER